MATHDYVIANGTGAAVRSDLNNALAAIVSNNSGSSEPATTYAYQWWADTNANVLKIRNSANNAWITLRELDGTMLIEDGSASSPGLAFADDLNTGIFSPAADQIGFATGGAERLQINSSEAVFNDPSNDVDFRVESNGNTHMLFVDAGNDRVGIGASAPENNLHVKASSGYAELRLEGASSAGGTLLFYEGSTKRADIFADPSSNIVFRNTGESARIDSSGRLLVGTTTAGDAGADNLTIADSGAAGITIRASSSTSSAIYFADGTSGTQNYQGIVQYVHSGDELQFYTNYGASSAVRMRIDYLGNVGINFAPKVMHANVTSSLNVGSSNIFQRTNNSFFTSNFYYNSSDVGKSIASGYGVMYSQNTADGRHNFNVSAASAGSADATHSLQTKASIDNDGLKFNGDTAAANALDDYEEGSWTPAVYSGGYSAITVVSAKYTKIGNLVNVQCYADGYIGTGSSVSLVLQGLPFDSLNNGYAPGSVDFGKGGVKGTYSRTESDNDRISFIYPSEANAGRINLKGNQIYNDAYTILNLTYITDE